jgi:hypothetical protein
MKRAAVIIGVNKTGNLPQLQAAVTSAKEVCAWAKAQNFASIALLTDESQRLSVGQVKDAIKNVVSSGTFEQLVVYFSGHGVNIAQSEYWLLTEAPGDPNEAVNVEGSARLARRSGIPHVVFISDACRTAAEGIQAQDVEGSNIFPNRTDQGQEKKIDLFFATILGSPAFEIKDPNAATAQYKAIYTAALTDSLNGLAPECLERVQENGNHVDLVRPWALKEHLDKELPHRMAAANVPITVFQLPDARITSPPSTWLSRIVPPPGSPPPTGPAPKPPVPQSPTFRSATRVHPETAFFGRKIATLEHAVGPLLAESAEDVIAQEAKQRSTPFGRAHFESRCGFKVRGANLVEAYHPTRFIHLDGPDSAAVFGPRPANHLPVDSASVVLRFDNNKGTILPAIPEFVTGLTFDGEELVDVVYEPADTGYRWAQYQNRLDELRRLRGRISAAARFGMFRLEGTDALEVAKQLQYAKGLDPTMAVYAAYAYDSLQQTERIRQMDDYLFGDLHVHLFDVALLAGLLNNRAPGKVEGLFPAVPMLSQGWALLSAHDVEQSFFRSLRRSMERSLWTLFNSSGVEDLKTLLKSGEIH